MYSFRSFSCQPRTSGSNMIVMPSLLGLAPYSLEIHRVKLPS